MFDSPTDAAPLFLLETRNCLVHVMWAIYFLQWSNMHVFAPPGFKYRHPAGASSIHGIFVSFR